MADRVALVTGANGGLGTHVTNALLDAGFLVVGLARTIKASDFTHPHFTALSAKLDSLDSARRAADTVVARFGKMQRMFDQNFASAFHILRAVIPYMHKAGAGRIIGIGSRAAEAPAATIGAYSASKAAFSSLMRTVALENKDAGITANVILPGTIDTTANRNAMPGADTSQWVQPATIASLVVWLASDAAKDVTGATIPVYGRGL